MNEQDRLDIVSHYEGYDEDSRFDPRWCRIEYLTTLHYIRRYLQPGDKVLEIGAGTGRYSLALAKEGYDVTSVELVPHNLDILRSKITEDMSIHTMEGNALDLSVLPDETFDMTLLLGPMYHLFSDEDKRRALSEALRVTKRGGIVMVAYCIIDGSLINYVFRQGLYHEMVEKGSLDPETLQIHGEKGGFLFEHIRKPDIDRLMNGFSVQRLHYVATDGIASFLERDLDAMDEEMWQAVMRYQLIVCEREDMVGATDHSLDIMRKI